MPPVFAGVHFFPVKAIFTPETPNPYISKGYGLLVFYTGKVVKYTDENGINIVLNW